MSGLLDKVLDKTTYNSLGTENLGSERKVTQFQKIDGFATAFMKLLTLFSEGEETLRGKELGLQ